MDLATVIIMAMDGGGIITTILDTDMVDSDTAADSDINSGGQKLPVHATEGSDRGKR